MHLQGGSGAGLGIAALLSTGHCLAHWGGSSCCVWIENGFSLFSHLWSGKCMPPLFSEPSQTGKNDPSSSLVFLSYPSSPCLRLSCPPAKWCSTPVFYLRHSCVSKPQTSGAPEEQTHADPLEEGFPALWLVLACRRRQWLQHCASEFMSHPWAAEEEYWTISAGFMISLQKFGASNLVLILLYIPFLVFFPKFLLLSGREEWMLDKKGVRMRRTYYLTSRGTEAEQKEEISTGRGKPHL
ncbi:uncharacterized protein LOC117803761 [Ailuropoda melanoleuca]|uniref:uncharacterized protein LOC117803761 n=1 Tax=Ailuropoda melanoleuca TaxID=9646 RepID=UPI001494F73E|nr:uncharacterized protein LOC117803761 [Ailuropoda melanoleuca]